MINPYSRVNSSICLVNYSIISKKKLKKIFKYETPYWNFYRYNDNGTTHQKKLSDSESMSANEARTIKKDKLYNTPITLQSKLQLEPKYRSITLWSSKAIRTLRYKNDPTIRLRFSFIDI